MRVLKYEVDKHNYKLYFLRNGEEKIVLVQSPIKACSKKQIIELTEEYYNEKFTKYSITSRVSKLIQKVFQKPKLIYEKWSEKKGVWISKYKLLFLTYYKTQIFINGKTKVRYKLI